MYGLTRGTITLIGAAAAGFLLWLATQINDNSTGGYWIALGLLAAAGLIMAFSQLLGGWTKWGWPRVSGSVFLLAFLPALVVGGWILLAGQPHGNWFHDHVLSWSKDIHVRGLVDDLHEYIPVLAFGLGLLFGFTFDTTGPRREVVREDRVVEPAVVREPVASPAYDREPAATDAPAGLTAGHDSTVEPAPSDRAVEIREGGAPTTTAPPPEPPPRTGGPE
jgi:hypothetical protein